MSLFLSCMVYLPQVRETCVNCCQPIYTSCSCWCMVWFRKGGFGWEIGVNFTSILYNPTVQFVPVLAMWHYILVWLWLNAACSMYKVFHMVWSSTQVVCAFVYPTNFSHFVHFLRLHMTILDPTDLCSTLPSYCIHLCVCLSSATFVKSG